MTQWMQRTGGRILVEQLEIHGVKHAFCVPGESYLEMLDALRDSSIALTVCRHEGGAAMMAEAAGKLTGVPGICLVTRAPGATNASPGLHIAMHDSTPMILLVGQVERGALGREAFQELDYRAFFSGAVKWATEIDDARRIPELISRAFHVATSGRAGPVVVSLPEDMLKDTVEVDDARPYLQPGAAPGAEELRGLRQLLSFSERPLVIAGGSGWDARAVDDLVEFAERQQLPVAVSFRRQMLFPASHPHFVGDIGVGANPALIDYVRGADLVLLLGGRLSELPSQNYTLLKIPAPDQTLVHVYPAPDEIGRLYRPDLAFIMAPRHFLRTARLMPSVSHDRRLRVAEGRRLFQSWNEAPAHAPGTFNLAEAVGSLRTIVADDSIVCNGAGNYSAWVHRFHRYERYGTQLAPTSGSMGYGVPAAVAAKRIQPDKTVIAFAGDGCFLMNGQEFATAVQYKLPIVVVIADNGMYGTIRMHQEREYPGRVVATDLRNPDFVGYAECFGGYGERVERTADFAPALARAIASAKPAILHCIVDPQAITPDATLDQIRSSRAAAGAAD
jgi:acetolactate synthase I/II/III large subunit